VINIPRMKPDLKFKAVVILFCLMITWPVLSQSRKNIYLPNIPGYIILKGDFHLHTPFSDGDVWPTERVMEAWRDGLDVIALTDHVEYSPNKTDVIPNLNRPYEIAKPVADEHGILLIRAAEITREMPLGHFNAYFLTDNNALKKTDCMEEFQAAANQGAYFVWNHPGWQASKTDTTIWTQQHTEFYQKGWMNGIEVFNSKEYYPLVHKWAIAKKLSIFGNSDSHTPIDFEYASDKGEKRPFTLVFAKERSIDGVKEAFINHRTACYFNDTLAGNHEFLQPLLMRCIAVQDTQIVLNEKNEARIVLNNISGIPFTLKAVKNEMYSMPKNTVLEANSSVIIPVSKIKGLHCGMNELKLQFAVSNVLTNMDTPLTIAFNINIFAWQHILISKAKEGEWKIDCKLNNPDEKVYYSIDGSTPGQNSFPLSRNFNAAGKVLLKMACFKKNKLVGGIYEAKYVLHQGIGQKTSLISDADSRYYAGGASSLTDGVFASEDYKDGKWLGFEKKDMEALIELDQPRNIKGVEVNFLENTHSWIFLPSAVEIMVSSDGNKFTSLGIQTFAPATRDKNRGITTAEIKKQAKQIKFIKVIAKNTGVCPSWHPGKGKPAWLFVDEIVVE
jgi:3',5'-nucleoside bisphosphate phosphatase